MNAITQADALNSYTFSLPADDNNEYNHPIFLATNVSFDHVCRRIAKMREDELNAFIASLEKF